MKHYYLDNKRVARPKEVSIDGVIYIPPTDEQLIAAGYSIVDEPASSIKRQSKSYGQRVDQLIRQRYSISEELAIQRQRESKLEEFREYFNFCEQCKLTVKESMNKV